jgi:hypothetical protein
MAAQDEGIGRHNGGLRRTRRGAPDPTVFAPYMYLDVESGAEMEATGDDTTTAIRHRHGSLASCGGHGALAPPYPCGGRATSVSGAPANACRDENFMSPPKIGAGIGARLEKSFSARHLFSWTGPSAGVALMG